MKTDRLIAITMYLLSHESASAGALARRFEVSRRTILRDMESLSMAGIPISASPGAGGGYHIMEGFCLKKQLALPDDYQTIATALQGLFSALGCDRVGAMLKKAQDSVKEIKPHIFVDFSAARENSHTERSLPLIEQAITSKTPLSITYENASGHGSCRVVEPLALSYRWHAWYMFAYCWEKKDYRLFKLPRITAAEPASGPFTREHGDIEKLMKAHGEKGMGKTLPLRLLCKKETRVQVLEYLNGVICQEYENGDFILQMTVPMERMWFSLLMGFGSQVKVLEPDEVKEMLKVRAQEIIGMYP